MKLQLNQSAVIDGLIHIGCLAVGVAVGRAAVNVLPQEHKTIAQAGVAGTGLMASAAMSKEKSKLGGALRSIATGAAAGQAYDAITGVARKSYTVKENPTTVDKAVQGALGLGCPDGSCASAYLANSVPTMHFPINELDRMRPETIDTEAEIIDVSAVA